MQFNIHFPATQKLVQQLIYPALFVLIFFLSSCAIITVEDQAELWDPLVEQGASTELGISRSISTESPALTSLLNQADQAIEQQQWSEALNSLERAQRIDSKQSAIWTRLSIVYLAKQDPEQAIQMAKKSNSHAQNNKSVLAYNWLLISRAHLQMNQIDQAKAATQQSQQYLQK